MKHTKFWLVLSLILFASGIGLAAAGTAMGGTWRMRFDLSDFKMVTGSDDYVENTVKINDSFSKLEIDNSVIDITIKRGTECRVDYRVPEDLEPVVEVKGNTLRVYSKDKGGISFFNFTMIGDEDSYITITIPEDIAEKGLNFDVETSTGDIRVEDVNFQGRIESSTGDTTLVNLTAGNLEIEESTGDAVIENCEIKGDLKTSASTGTVTIKNTSIDGKYSAETSTGDIEVYDSGMGFFKMEGSTSDLTFKNVAVADVNIDTSTGDVKLSIDGNEDDYSIKLHTSTGDMNVAGREMDGKNFELVKGNNKIVIETSTGDIDIDFKK